MKTWKKILAPTVVFLLGGVTGVALTVLVGLRQLRQLAEVGPAAAVARGATFVTRRLDLDVNQREKFAPLVATVTAEFEHMRIEDMSRVRLQFENAAARLRPELRPDQQKKLDELLAAPRSRWNSVLPPLVRPLSLDALSAAKP